MTAQILHMRDYRPKPRLVDAIDMVESLDSFGFPVEEYYSDLPCDVEPLRPADIDPDGKVIA